MLILFDIDATLITTGGLGVRAMGEAGRATIDPAFDESTVEYAGRLDPLIIADLLRVHRQPVNSATMSAFRVAYREQLEKLLQLPNSNARACPGAIDLIHALQANRELTLGLLTGNFPETGAMKLRAAGIKPEWFDVAAWGCDSPHEPPARDHLPPVAIARFREIRRRSISPKQTVIIGDTPHDVSCAKAHGCRALAVATGKFSRDQLEAAGADLAVDSLVETSVIVEWIGAPESPRRQAV